MFQAVDTRLLEIWSLADFVPILIKCWAAEWIRLEKGVNFIIIDYQTFEHVSDAKRYS